MPCGTGTLVLLSQSVDDRDAGLGRGETEEMQLESLLLLDYDPPVYFGSWSRGCARLGESGSHRGDGFRHDGKKVEEFWSNVGNTSRERNDDRREEPTW
jgi:hypothetical protein